MWMGHGCCSLVLTGIKDDTFVLKGPAAPPKLASHEIMFDFVHSTLQ